MPPFGRRMGLPFRRTPFKCLYARLHMRGIQATFSGTLPNVLPPEFAVAPPIHYPTNAREHGGILPPRGRISIMAETSAFKSASVETYGP